MTRRLNPITKFRIWSLFNKDKKKNLEKNKKKLDALLRSYYIYASDTLIEEICKIFEKN